MRCRSLCPFGWSVEHRDTTWGPYGCRRARGQRAAGRDIMVCHGDACSPNTLIAPDGAFAGHVDLGMLGLADCWPDLAVATHSLE